MGITLGASVASLVGLYLAAAALIAVAAVRRAPASECRRRDSCRGPCRDRRNVRLAQCRSRASYASGSLRRQNAKPGQYAGSWSQRLIFSYIGYQIFIDEPVLGTGLVG